MQLNVLQFSCLIILANFWSRFWPTSGRSSAELFGRTFGGNGRTVRVRPNHVFGRSVVHYFFATPCYFSHYQFLQRDSGIHYCIIIAYSYLNVSKLLRFQMSVSTKGEVAFSTCAVASTFISEVFGKFCAFYT